MSSLIHLVIWEGTNFLKIRDQIEEVPSLRVWSFYFILFSLEFGVTAPQVERYTRIKPTT